MAQGIVEAQGREWLGVEMRHLAALLAVHEERSFRGAAERLGYVQSAVSQQISQLERLVGTRLVERSRGQVRPVALTHAGELLLAHGTQIMGQLDAAQADLRSLADGGPATFRVGVPQSVAMRLLPGALLGLRRAHPELVIDVQEENVERRLFGRVASGELDLAFAELPLMAGPFEGLEILVDPCVLLVPAASARAKAGPPQTLADLVELPLVRVKGWLTLDLIERQLAAAGVAPNFALTADATPTVQALVGSGCGAALLPGLAVQADDPRVVAHDVSHLLPSRRLAVYWQAGRRHREVVQAFTDAVLSVTRRLRMTAAA